MHNYKPIIKLLKNRIKNNQLELDDHLKYWGYAHWSDTTDYGYQSELFAIDKEITDFKIEESDIANTFYI